MGDSDVTASPKRVKRLRSSHATEDSLQKPSQESDKTIPNGTGDGSPESLTEVVKEKTKTPIKITKITKVVKSERKPENKPSDSEEPSKCDSPSSSDETFHGFQDVASDRRNRLLKLVDELRDQDGSNGSDTAVEDRAESEAESRHEEDMTVDTGHVSDSDSARDSDQMEIDMGNDKETLSKADSAEYSDTQDKTDQTRDSDAELMETDSVKSAGSKVSKNVKTENLENDSIPDESQKGKSVEYCGGCSTQVDDSEDGICCDGKCERWFHLRCSGLTDTEYEELGRDENAKWACNKCSGKSPPAVKADQKPLLSVRKDLAKVSTPSPAKRKSMAREGGRTPKIDISNPAFLKPFDYGWKRELVFRSTNDSSNKRQGDIYYYTPKGKKLRSLREISEHLVGTDLTPDNFTFWKEPLGTDDPNKEIIRDAKLKMVTGRDSSTTPVVAKKATTPKITKTPKTTPKLTATVTPLESPSVQPVAPATTVPASTPTNTTPKASASVTPRVVFKGKGTGPKFKVTPSKSTTPGQTQKIVISKEKKKKTANEDEEMEMGMLPPMWEPLPKPKETKAGVKRALEPSVEESAPSPKRSKATVPLSQFNMNYYMQSVNNTHNFLVAMFQYLKLHEVLRCSRVCRMWRDAAMSRTMWETVKMKNTLVTDWDGFAAALNRQNTVTLDLRKILMPDKQDALKAMWGNLIKALSKVKTMTRIELCRCTSYLVEQVAAVCPQMEYIGACTIKSNQLNLANLGNCHNLVELRLKSQASMELNNLAVLTNMTKLKTLSLTMVKNTNDVLETVSKMPWLEALELGDLSTVTEEAVTKNLPLLTRLKRLRLEKGQQQCPTDTFLQTISLLPSLYQLELINFDIKAGFEDSLGLCTNVKTLFIIPTYVTQSATTNHLVIEGVGKLSKTLNFFIWGLTLELLRVTDLFIDQWEMGRKNNNGEKSPTTEPPPVKKTYDNIPILKPPDKDGKNGKEGAVTQVDVLQLPKLNKVLKSLLPSTKILIVKVPFSQTWRQTVENCSANAAAASAAL